MTDVSIGEGEFEGLMAALGADSVSDPVAVAVSGGSDSMALVCLAAAWANRRGIGLTALTVDHGLRPDSAAEAAQTAEWLNAREIRHVGLHWTDEKPRTGIQAAAREARYRLMTMWCRQNGVSGLLLGHQMEDQAETVLMRLARGSGLDGLVAMEPVVEAGGVRLLRPLLTIPRARLRATLRDIGQQWLEDPSNEDPRFTRTKIGEGLALLGDQPATASRIGNAARRMARARDALELAASEWLRFSVTLDPAGFALVDAPSLRRVHEELALRGLARLLRCVSGGQGPVRLERLEALFEALMKEDADASAGRTLNGCVVRLLGSEFLICREEAKIEPPTPILAGEPVVWDGRFEVCADLRTGAALPPGLKVGRLGDDGWRRVAETVPQARKSALPAQIRRALPTLWSGDKVVANPHLGFVGDEAGLWLSSLRVKFRADGLSNTDELSKAVILNSPLS